MPIDWADAERRNPHLALYLKDWRQKALPMPELRESLGRDMKEKKVVNVLYPVGDPIFIHVYDDAAEHARRYVHIEPQLTKDEQKKLRKVKEAILRLAPYEETPHSTDELRSTLRRLLERSVTTGAAGGPLAALGSVKLVASLNTKIVLTADEKRKIQYYLERDIVDSGPIEPIIRDPYIEDISSVGVHPIFVIHKVFDTVETSLKFTDDKELDD